MEEEEEEQTEISVGISTKKSPATSARFHSLQQEVVYRRSIHFSRRLSISRSLSSEKESTWHRRDRRLSFCKVLVHVLITLSITYIVVWRRRQLTRVQKLQFSVGSHTTIEVFCNRLPQIPTMISLRIAKLSPSATNVYMCL